MAKFFHKGLARACLVGLVLAGAALGRHLGWLRTLSYGPLLALARQHTEWQTRDWLEVESEHFRFKYRPGDAGIIRLVLETAEEAYRTATEFFAYRPREKTLVIVYPDRQSLAQQFGWAADEGAMGVYWAGVVRVLSPLDWVTTETGLVDIFKSQGPMLHEFTHLLVDELARGNCPRWLTEGIAQYVERQVTGYELPGPKRHSGWYPLKDMDYGFDRLPDQALAYRQSLLMVDYLVEKGGWEGVKRLLSELGRGVPLDRALPEVMGLELGDLEAALFTVSL